MYRSRPRHQNWSDRNGTTIAILVAPHGTPPTVLSPGFRITFFVFRLNGNLLYPFILYELITLYITYNLLPLRPLPSKGRGQKLKFQKETKKINA